ncbi:hypothetical protein [Enterococcus sp. AZ194]
MNDKNQKEDLPIDKMILGMVMLIFSPIIIGLVVATAWLIYAMLSTR